MRKYTAEIFKTHKLMARTINKHWQPKNKNTQNTNEVHGGAGLIDGTSKKQKKGKRGQGGKKGTSGQETGHGSDQTNSKQGGLGRDPTDRPKPKPKLLLVRGKTESN